MSAPPTFEEAQRELESIVQRLEAGQVPLDDAIALWERGEELYRLCRTRLDAAEGKMPEVPVDANGKKGKPALRLQVFKNTFIERWFAQAHPITPGIWFGPFVFYGLYRGAVDHGLYVVPAFLLGALIITLVEYCLHRFVFHFTPKNKEQRLQAFLLHGYHHEYPNDPYRLVLPPITCSISN